MADATRADIEAGGAYLPEPVACPVPMRDGLDAPFHEGARRGELRVQYCAACESFQWGPEWICWRCLSWDLEWRTVAPRGRIYSWERVWHPVHPALAGAVPYVVVLVELPQAGGVRMVGNLLGDPRAEIAIGGGVEAVFEHHRDADPPYALVQWARTA